MDSGSRTTHALDGPRGVAVATGDALREGALRFRGGARLQEVRGRPGPWRRLPSSFCSFGRHPGRRPRPPAKSSGLASRQPTSCRGRRPADGKRASAPSVGPGPGPGAPGREAGLGEGERSGGASVCPTPLAPWPGGGSQGRLATAASRSPLEGQAWVHVRGQGGGPSYLIWSVPWRSSSPRIRRSNGVALKKAQPCLSAGEFPPYTDAGCCVDKFQE